MFKVETVGTSDDHMSIHDTPEEAMQAVNRLRALALLSVTIKDELGRSVSERQLAMVVMARRLRSEAAAGTRWGEQHGATVVPPAHQGSSIPTRR